jgi:hypothetical protein
VEVEWIFAHPQEDASELPRRRLAGIGGGSGNPSSGQRWSAREFVTEERRGRAAAGAEDQRRGAGMRLCAVVAGVGENGDTRCGRQW